MKYFIIIFSTSMFLLSCNSKNQEKDLPKEYIKASIDKENEFPYSDYIIDYELIPLETSKEALIGQIHNNSGRIFYLIKILIN